MGVFDIYNKIQNQKNKKNKPWILKKVYPLLFLYKNNEIEKENIYLEKERKPFK